MSKSSTEVVSSALWKGCLGGILLTLVFFVISGLVFGITLYLQLPEPIMMVASIASGPVIGTLLLAGYLLFRKKLV